MDSESTSKANALTNLMSRLPYPVTIVTARVGERQRGITIGSFTSLSLDPPLISFNVDQEAQMHDFIFQASHFAVHIPEQNQTHLCNRFAEADRSGKEQFKNIAHIHNEHGTPILEDLTYIHCKKYAMFEIGDHSIVVGEVLNIEKRKENMGVLYHNRSYRRVGKPAAKIASQEDKE
ncbi:MAG TPA: flavin reductase family protein [Balneolaceae bacterium]|nr:flavin reductase family protein [Balneolaceae bacterium]